jgi:hypothetical protein
MRRAWKMPPLIKAYEAMGALGDGRVQIVDEHRTLVASSDASKTYEVETADANREISSNDNASYWQGYLGYPGIAALLARGLYKPRPEALDALRGIPWKELNRRFRNDYSKTLSEMTRLVCGQGYDPEAIRAEAEAVIDAVKKLAPYQGKRRRPPAERTPRRPKKVPFGARS